MINISPPTYINNFINIEPPRYTDRIDFPPSYEIIFLQNIEPIQSIRSNVIVPMSVPCREGDNPTHTTALPLYLEFFSCNKLICDLLYCNNCCYRQNSSDTRCCGICYYNCPLKEDNYNININDRDQLEFCLPNMNDYCKSGYIITYNIVPRNDCSGCCLPYKLIICMPCLLGTLFNHCINCIRSTNTNYLF